MLTNPQSRLAASLTAFVLFVCSFASVPLLQAQSAESASPHGLEGAWWVTVTLYNCSTGVQRPPFSSILLFSRGGTLSETTSNPAFLAGQRSTGFGTWAQSSNGTYAASDVAYILFTGGPFTQGTQKLIHSITVSHDGSQFTDNATVGFYDNAGNQIMAACASAKASRLQ